MYGYVYLTTNTITNHIYIGQHKATMFEPDKYLGSGVILTWAIKKYGKENFKNELICECLTQEELDEKEIYYIAYYNATDRNIGYNIQTGGKGNGSTTEGYVWMNNGEHSLSTRPEFIDRYLANGYVFGRLSTGPAWNAGRSKDTDTSLQQISEIRKQKIAAGEIRCCYGLKGKESPNYRSEESFLLEYDANEFVDFWHENGRCKTATKYHIRTELVDRILNYLGIKETKEHKSYIYSKARKKLYNK